MITSIIFDLGGVILTHEIDIMPRILRRMFPDQFTKAHAFWGRYASRLLTGKISSREVIRRMKKQVETAYTFEDLCEMWTVFYAKEAMRIDDDVLRLADRLKKSYKVYLLTDMIDALDTAAMRQLVFDKFDRVFKSFEMGQAKFEGGAVYKTVLEELQVKAKECIFIDDREVNIINAGALGMHGIVYKNLPQLRREINVLLPKEG